MARRKWLDEEQYNAIKRMLDNGFSQKEVSVATRRSVKTICRINTTQDFQEYIYRQRHYHRNREYTGASGVCVTFTVKDVTYLSDESINVVLKTLQAVFGTQKVSMSYSGLNEIIEEGE